MQLRKSERRQAKIKLALQGVSGSGKSMSGLLMAYGITNDWSKIAAIDTEKSIDLYAHLGNFSVLTLSQPYTPEDYIEAIEICENAGCEVILIDSLSHCWEYLLEYHSGLQGNSFLNWSKVGARLNKLIQKILNSDTHILVTMRSKTEYILNDKNGKIVPEKAGMKAVMRDNIDYDFTIVLEIDIKHNATASKDRTGLFMGKSEFVINPETGQRLQAWCHSGVNVDMIRKQIQEAKSMEELSSIYHQHSDWSLLLAPDFMKKKADLQTLISPKPQVPNQQNLIRYGNNSIIPSRN